jgi:hypothetical protein
MPRISKACLLGDHTHVAIRFLPQQVLVTLAELTVSPIPDVQIRIIMLYKNIYEDRLKDWPNANARRDLGEEHWRNSVGIGQDTAERLQDEALFRVFEWGTVEVDS